MDEAQEQKPSSTKMASSPLAIFRVEPIKIHILKLHSAFFSNGVVVHCSELLLLLMIEEAQIGTAAQQRADTSRRMIIFEKIPHTLLLLFFRQHTPLRVSQS